MTPTLRVGVIGAGIGEQYVAAFGRQPGVEVAAVCTRTPESADRLADRHAVTGRYVSLHRMIEREELDVVVVATPNHLHHAATVTALDAGAHVVCEKPLALGGDQARDMALRARAAGRRNLTSFTWRFLPAAQHVKELLDAGVVGRPYHAYVRYFVCGWGDPRSPMRWQFDVALAGGGAIANLGSHAIDLVRWWLGDVRRVLAALDTAVETRPGPDGEPVDVTVDDNANVIAELDGGIPVVLSLSSVACGPRVSVELGVLGSEGAIALDEDWTRADAANGRVRVARGPERAWEPIELPRRLLDPAVPTPAGDPFAGCFHRMAAEMVGAIREERPAVPGFEDGVATQDVVDAALSSAASGGWTAVGPARDRVAAS